MASIATVSKPMVVVPKTMAKTGLRPMPATVRVNRMAMPAREMNQLERRNAITANAVPMEVAQVASEGGFIFGVAGTMFAITLIGLAIGFVILRVESLVEEGKI